MKSINFFKDEKKFGIFCITLSYSLLFCSFLLHFSAEYNIDSTINFMNVYGAKLTDLDVNGDLTARPLGVTYLMSMGYLKWAMVMMFISGLLFMSGITNLYRGDAHNESYPIHTA